MKNIPFGKPLVSNKEFNSVLKVLKSGKYVHGKKTLEFEKNFKKLTGAKYAISLSSCTAGMHLFYLSQGIKEGDEVIVPAQTHVATAHAIEIVGAKPVFVDCELRTGNINTDKIVEKISKRTKAIAVVHFLGIPVNMEKILKIAKKYKLLVLEDCALAVGSKIKKKHVGLYGDAGVFSFYPVKHITSAEGGMLITNDRKLYDLVKSKKAFGVDKSYNQRDFPGKYDVKDLGINYRMSEIHAAIGVEQLKKVNTFLQLRERNFNLLFNELKDLNEISILKNEKFFFSSSNYCLSIIFKNLNFRKRTKLIKLLNSKGIGTSIYYPKPVPLMTYYKKKYGLSEKEFPFASKISYQSIALPVGPHVSISDIKYISKNIKNTLKL
jgi:perosamine synthetase